MLKRPIFNTMQLENELASSKYTHSLFFHFSRDFSVSPFRFIIIVIVFVFIVGAVVGFIVDIKLIWLLFFAPSTFFSRNWSDSLVGKSKWVRAQMANVHVNASFHGYCNNQNEWKIRPFFFQVKKMRTKHTIHCSTLTWNIYCSSSF